MYTAHIAFTRTLTAIPYHTQAQLRAARALIGAPHPAAPERPDISRAALEYGRLELARLGAEKVCVWGGVAAGGVGGGRGRREAGAKERDQNGGATLEHQAPSLTARPRHVTPPPPTQERREARLGATAAALRALCADVGEDAEAALGEVHPSLSCVW